MSFFTRRKCTRRAKKLFIHLGLVHNERTLFGSVENTVRLDKTRQLHQRIRCSIYNMANRERKQTKRAVFSYVIQLCICTINPIRFGGGGALNASPSDFCPHAFNFGATYYCALGTFPKK